MNLGLPWIQLTFHFEIGWDWPDEEMGRCRPDLQGNVDRLMKTEFCC